MRRLSIRFLEWVLRIMNEAYHQERETTTEEDRAEWVDQRQVLYDELKKAKKEQP